MNQLKEWLNEFIKTRLPFLTKERVAQFVNALSMREKIMILAMAGVIFLALDYWLLVRPTSNAFKKTFPELSALQLQTQDFRDDLKNKTVIEKNWQKTKDVLTAKESSFIAPGEVPRLLESLSKLAADSGVRIASLYPIEIKRPGKHDVIGPYARIPIKISAEAGAHELGTFLARLEGGQTYFRVSDLKIHSNPAQNRRHMVELDIDAFRHS